MANLKYDRFVRVLTRCVELAGAPGKPPIIGHVYKAGADPATPPALPEGASTPADGE